MEDFRQFATSVAEAIRGLQAAEIAQARVLRAIIASHPDPDALREAWRRYAAPSIADASLSVATDPQRQAVHQALADALAQWDGYLAHDLPRRGQSRD